VIVVLGDLGGVRAVGVWLAFWSRFALFSSSGGVAVGGGVGGGFGWFGLGGGWGFGVWVVGVFGVWVGLWGGVGVGVWCVVGGVCLGFWVGVGVWAGWLGCWVVRRLTLSHAVCVGFVFAQGCGAVAFACTVLSESCRRGCPRSRPAPSRGFGIVGLVVTDLVPFCSGVCWFGFFASFVIVPALWALSC